MNSEELRAKLAHDLDWRSYKTPSGFAWLQGDHDINTSNAMLDHVIRAYKDDETAFNMAVPNWPLDASASLSLVLEVFFMLAADDSRWKLNISYDSINVAVDQETLFFHITGLSPVKMAELASSMLDYIGDKDGGHNLIFGHIGLDK